MLLWGENCFLSCVLLFSPRYCSDSTLFGNRGICSSFLIVFICYFLPHEIALKINLQTTNQRIMMKNSVHDRYIFWILEKITLDLKAWPKCSQGHPTGSTHGWVWVHVGQTWAKGQTCLVQVTWGSSRMWRQKQLPCGPQGGACTSNTVSTEPKEGRAWGIRGLVSSSGSLIQHFWMWGFLSLAQKEASHQAHPGFLCPRRRGIPPRLCWDRCLPSEVARDYIWVTSDI